MTSSRSAIWYLVFENDLVHGLDTLSTTKFDANAGLIVQTQEKK